MPAIRLGPSLGLAIAAVVLTTIVDPVWAQQAYPARPITIVVPAAAGGPTDAMARLMRAIERVTADRSLHTPDLGGNATTAQVTKAVCNALAQDNE